MDFWQKRNEKHSNEQLRKEGFVRHEDDRGNVVWKMPRKPTKLVVLEISGRPIRDNVISNEDIINLNISLNVSRSLEEFIEAV